MKKASTIEEYINSSPPESQEFLEKIRETIKAVAPKAEEVISYGIPAFRGNGILVYFGAFKKHIGFFPTAQGIEQFKKELSIYKGARGSVQFPYSKPMPFALIKKIVKFRVKVDAEKSLTRKKLSK